MTLKLRSKDVSEQILWNEFTFFYEKKSKQAFESLQKSMRDSGDPGIVIKNLPRSNVEVLIFAYKTCRKAPIFNFEAVFNKYTRFKL